MTMLLRRGKGDDRIASNRIALLEREMVTCSHYHTHSHCLTADQSRCQTQGAPKIAHEFLKQESKRMMGWMCAEVVQINLMKHTFVC